MTPSETTTLVNRIMDLIEHTSASDRVEMFLNLLASEIAATAVSFKNRKFDRVRFDLVSTITLQSLAATLAKLRTRFSDPAQMEIVFQEYAEAMAKKEGRLQ